MAEQKTSTIDTIVSGRPALTTDLNPSYISKEAYSYARNAVRNSKEGDLGTIGNEPSPTLCFNAPYKVLGTVSLPDEEILVFSGDGIQSEIGIGSVKTCEYRTVYSSQCLKFNTDYPIMGVARKDFQKGILATFTDKYNPVRRFELNKLSSKTTCDDLLLFKKISTPCLSVKKGQVGNIPNGMYSVAIAYSLDNQVFSDYYSITNRIGLNSETGSNSLEVSISNLDTEFDNFVLVLVGSYIDPTTKGVTKVAKQVGVYSTKVKTVSITDFLNTEYPNILLSSLVIKKNTWQKAGIISANSSYLVLADLVGRDEENYQLKAMSIEAEYVVEQVEANYYEEDGQDVGYYRDENYDFAIQGVYNTGEYTDAYHIPGRKFEDNDEDLVSTVDVYELDQQFADCEENGKIKRWQVYNTAELMVPYTNTFKCNRRTLGHGKMGYFQSTELYPDNKDMFGDDRLTNIRYHKMPDESKIPRYSKVEGKTYINILGVRFKNIPQFDNPDIVGYRIIRSDRKGGNGTVIARGLMTNLRSYTDPQLNQEVLFSNYPVNDLSPDVYLSSTQTAFKSNREYSFNPLTAYYKDRFSFYSPHTLFEPRYSLGSEIKIEAEEIATITGQFELVHDHPRAKLMNQFAFWLAASVGFIESTLVLLGKKKQSTAVSSGEKLSVPPAKESNVVVYDDYSIQTIDDLISFDLIGYVTALTTSSIGISGAIANAGKITKIKNIISAALKIIASLAIKVPYSIFAGIKEADEIFDIIYDFTGFTDYVYQYNAHAIFDQSIPSIEGNKRRRLIRPATYIPSDVVTIDDKLYNNYSREKNVYLQFNREIADPTTVDTSRNTISGFGICDNLNKKVTSTGSAFYATSKSPNPNQYGGLGSANKVSMHSCTLEFAKDKTESPILWGGDCIITRFQMLKKMQFFNQNMANKNFPDGTEYDYNLYRNIAYPRFWMDTTKFDFSQVLSGKSVNFTTFSRTTTSKHNLDCKKSKDGKNIARVDDAYMYLSNNAVIDFFVEADYNLAYREKGKESFFSRNSSNVSLAFRSDKIDIAEEFLISRAYSDIYTTEIFAQQQRDDFDPLNPIPVSQPNSVIYSLPSFNLQQVDNWQYFLPANFFSFRESDFGKLTAIHKMDQDRVLFLFSRSSPYISMGRDFLQLENSGRKITIGDGGLFAQDPREVMPTDNNYGACNSRYAFSNTHLGRYYPSESQGRIINFSENSLDDITRQGMSYWCKNYMPIFLYKYFPGYPEEENPISGVGYLMAFDSFNETVYVTKRDFAPKQEYVEDIKYEKGSFTYKGDKISVRDNRYFNDVSWTLSYSPIDKSFVSWHDWHPDWIIQTDDHFISVKDNGLYKHNDNTESFCNYYGKDYPFEIEYISSSGQQIETVRSIEYLLEVYHYKNRGRNRFHVLNENFDRLLVSNTEQISPLLNLHHGNPNPEENLFYPKKSTLNNVSYDIPFFKEENKYRVNMFWDATKDRGEFSSAEYHLLPTDESGYKSVVNPVAVDLNKPEEQRKKFRHYFNKFRLTKTISGNNKFLTKLLNIKKLISSR